MMQSPRSDDALVLDHSIQVYCFGPLVESIGQICSINFDEFMRAINVIFCFIGHLHTVLIIYYYRSKEG